MSASRKIHRPLAEACVVLLGEVTGQGRVLDHVVARAFRENKRWGKRDRHFIAESLWEVVRWKRLLAELAGDDDPRSLLAAAWLRLGREVPAWWSWPGAPASEILAQAAREAEFPRAVRESVPDWLDGLGAADLGAGWDAELAALNRRAPVFLRVNTLHASFDEVRDWLRTEGVRVGEVAGAPEALRLPDGATLPKRLARDGRIEIQDAGSQQIVPMLGVEPGMRVVDACAGAGGKTLQIAAAMQGRGEIVALDVSERKLEALRVRAEAAGVRNLRVERWRSDTLCRLNGWADRVLIDAPCSGLGTLRRQPDLKWRLSPERIAKLRRTQRKLLDHYPGMMRAGGRTVYATCSVLGVENEGQVAAFVERDGRRLPEEERRISVAETGWDGFYAVRLA